MKNNVEIERKFLLKYLPNNYDKYPLHFIEQSYISLSNPEHRIRKKDNKYYETFKGEGDISRTEDEKEIDKNKYNELLNNKISRSIFKYRYMIPLNNNLMAELNIYQKELKGLFLIEVEFPSIEEANNFITPDWFLSEVTNNIKFKNQYLATCSIENINDLINNYYKMGVDVND